jgi:hypothetical protein
MIHRKSSAPTSNALGIAACVIAAALLSATGFSVETAVAQQPPPAAPTAPKPSALTEQKSPPGAPGPTQGAAPEMRQLIYSPWAKFCGKGKDPGAKEVCFAGKAARTAAGNWSSPRR